jgi:hypothetical protein
MQVIKSTLAFLALLLVCNRTAFGKTYTRLDSGVVRVTTIDTIGLIHDSVLVRVTETKNGKTGTEYTAFVFSETYKFRRSLERPLTYLRRRKRWDILRLIYHGR